MIPPRGLPPAGSCTARLCCYPTPRYGAAHCFVLVTNSNGQGIFYTSHPEWKTRWACNCANAYLPIGVAGYLIGESGGYGTGFEILQPGTVCKDLGNRPCTAIQNCLQDAVNAQTAARVCYNATTGPNSNTGASTYLIRCGFGLQTPPTVPGYPTPGWPNQPPHWIGF